MIEHIHNKKIIGRLEYISFPDFEIDNIEAKVDTGAYSGAIHVSSVEEVKKDGQQVLRFKLIDPSHPLYQEKDFFSSEFSQKKVVSSNGESEVRYIIPARFLIGGQEYISQFSLSKREGMRRPVLLGRKNIKKHFLINAARKFVLGTN